jgi:hypothetical protein
MDQFEIEKQARLAAGSERRKQMTVVKAKRAASAAEALGIAGAADLDVRLLLDELTADQNFKWVSFVLPEGPAISISRQLLRNLATERRRRGSRLKTMRAWVDAAGLHLRWGQHGGMNLRSQLSQKKETLVVAFSREGKSAVAA